MEDVYSFLPSQSLPYSVGTVYPSILIFLKYNSSVVPQVNAEPSGNEGPLGILGIIWEYLNGLSSSKYTSALKQPMY